VGHHCNQCLSDFGLRGFFVVVELKQKKQLQKLHISEVFVTAFLSIGQ